MSSFHAIYYHLVWSTKHRQPFITEQFELHLYKYIFGILRNRGIQLLRLGGMPDHIHLLIKTGPDQSLPDLVKDIKVSSTKMMRLCHPSLQDFSWQSGYGAFSVSQEGVPSVKEYIKNQKEHHSGVSFEDEFRLILQRHEVQFDTRYVFG